MIERALVLALLAVAVTSGTAVGCMQTTVKPTERRILTAEEAAELKKQRETEKGETAKKDGTPVPEPRPRTPEAEIEYLRAQSEKEPQNPKWHFQLGTAYERMGKLELAELRYRKGGELIPRDQYTGPHFLLGRVLAKQDKYGAALAALKQAVAVKPPDVEGYYLNPDYRDAHFLMGAIYYKQKNMAESERCFKEFLKYGGDREKVVDFFPEMIAE